MSNLSEAMANVDAQEHLVAAVKRGTRPVTTLAPEAEILGQEPKRPSPTLFEENAVAQAEVRLLTHRQLEAALVEQLRLAERELAGVRRVIAGDEALLASHRGGL